METTTHPNGTAPAGVTYKLGAKGGRVALAWQHVYDRLTNEWQDGTELAADAASSLDLAPISVLAHLHRMSAEGVIEHEKRKVVTEITRTSKAGKVSTFNAERVRTHYRLKR